MKKQNKPLIFCIANQKGGVGKTTTALNLSAALQLLNQKVLLIDLDPQGNATMGSGIDKRSMQNTIYQLLIDQASFEQVVKKSDSGGYDILPANRDLSGAELDLAQFEKREIQLKKHLDKIEHQYDYILIDCPPTLSLLTLNGLACASGVIIPMQCEYFALEGLSDLVAIIKRIYANINKELQIIGLLRVMYDPRVTLQQQVSQQLEEHFKDKVFDTIIPRNVRLAEAPSYGVPGVVFDKNSKGALAYTEFAKELVNRL